jgi:hypothetical protein
MGFPVTPNFPRPPFIVGVTGLMAIHADDLAAVKAAVEKVFCWLVSSAPKGGGDHQGGGGGHGHGEADPCNRGLGLADTQVVVMSSLAPGADQLVARIGCAKGHRVVAPLPFPLELYKRASTFSEKTGAIAPQGATLRAAFETFLEEVPLDGVFHVLLADDLGRTDAELEARLKADLDCREARNRRYRAAGEYIAGFSDLLIAICDQAEPDEPDSSDEKDPLPADARSGTRDIVHARLNGLTPGLLPLPATLSWADNGPVVRIFARRAPRPDHGEKGLAKTGVGGMRAGDLAIWHPADSRPHPFSVEAWEEKQDEELRTIVRQLSEFNRMVAAMGAAPSGILEKVFPAKPPREYQPRSRFERWWPGVRSGTVQAWRSIAGVFWGKPAEGKAAERSWTGPLMPEKVERLAELREMAAKANREKFDPKVKRLAHTFWVLSFLVAVLIQFSESWELETPPPHYGWWQAAALAFAAWLFFKAWRLNYGKRQGREEDWQNDTRALAEALRVQCYWSAAGVGESVSANYLQRARSEAAWIRAAVSGMSFPFERERREFAARPVEEQVKILRRVMNGWVHGQRAFFEKSTHVFQSRHHALHFLGNLALSAGVGAMVTAFAGHKSRWAPWVEAASQACGPWVFLWVLCGMVALWLGYELLNTGACAHYRRRTTGGPLGGVRKLTAWLFQACAWCSHRMHHFGEKWLVVLVLGFAAGATADLALIFLHHAGGAEVGTYLPDPDRLGFVLKVLLFTAGALVHWWLSIKFFAENIRRYSAMAGLYRAAADRCEPLITKLEEQAAANAAKEAMNRTVGEVQDLLLVLGREAITENADWLLMHRNKPIDPFAPVG